MKLYSTKMKNFLTHYTTNKNTGKQMFNFGVVKVKEHRRFQQRLSLCAYLTLL